MHRIITIAVPPQYTAELVDKLKPVEHVLGITVDYGASVKPPGDVVAVTTLNRGTDDVMRLAGEAMKHGDTAITTAQAGSVSASNRQRQIDDDVDEGMWEEMESGLVHHGHLTVNYIVLMALGGIIAAAALVSEPEARTAAFIAASIIAPGYEPVAKIPLAAVLHRWPIVRNALVSVSVGYAVVIVAAVATLWLLAAAGQIRLSDLPGNAEIDKLIRPNLGAMLISGSAAIAGMVMIMSFRETVLAGPLIGLALIPAAVVVAAGMAAGDVGMVAGAGKRLLLDLGFTVVFGGVVAGLKQRLVHRRRPVV